ncbi:MAG TPA: hypothetical protein PLT26_16775 [Anaerolineaceae bacterium]|nr:hypothetical protein [Anaerolineaceae bacterium]
MATTSEIQKLLQDVCEAFPNYRPERLAKNIKFYALALEKFTPGIIEKAISKIIMTNRWFPTVSEMVEACTSILDEEAERLENMVKQSNSLRAQVVNAGCDPDKYENLASQFKEKGLTCGETACRLRSEHFRQSREANALTTN